MKLSRVIFLAILLLVNYFLIDFPGAKIVLYGAIVLLIVNKIVFNQIQKSFVVKRYMETQKIFAGLSENTSVAVANNSSLPIHALIMIDRSDLNISIEPNHYFLFSIDNKGSELISYNLFGRKRGKHTVGPTTIKYTDILGLNSFNIEIDTKKDVIVFPNIYQVSNMHFRSMQPYGVIKNKVPIFDDPTIIIGLKEYQFGDEIKKINWKVSAKYDKLYVNTYQPSISAASLIILDLFDDNYNIRNKDYYIEQAIEVAASLVKELFILRQEVSFACNCRIDNIDSIIKSDNNKGEAHFTSILTDLSSIESNRKILLRDLLDPSILNISWGVSVYVIVTHLDDISTYKLIDLYQSGHNITLINVGPEIKKDLSMWNIGFQSFYAEIEGNIINLLRI